MTLSAVLTTSAVASSALPVRNNLRLVEHHAPARNNHCGQCVLNALCVPDGLSSRDRQDYTSLVFHYRRLQPGQALFRAGEAFTHLFFVKTGSIKSMVLTDDGREQVTGFHFAGDALGLDALASGTHPSEAIALEETHVCAIAFTQFTRISQRVESLQSYLQRLLARELVRDQGLLLLLGRMQADERVATFLLSLSRRFMTRGFSPLAFTLPMAREDIGNYLGITLETVSRCFSRLKAAGTLAVDNRRIRILNTDALQKAACGEQPMH
jgi:CRP/FNR family transcriptional regulator, anaerobic regulatory protein